MIRQQLKKLATEYKEGRHQKVIHGFVDWTKKKAITNNNKPSQEAHIARKKQSRAIIPDVEIPDYLTDREKRIMKYRFESKWTLQEIADITGVSRQRIQQIIKKYDKTN